MNKPFKSLFVELNEMDGLYKKIEELLADKRNVALGSDRASLQRILDKPRTETYFYGRCMIVQRDFINGLYENHKRWEKIREQKRASQG